MEYNEPPDNLLVCMGCEEGNSKTRKMVGIPDGFICSECTRLMVDIVEGKRPDMKENFAPPPNSACSICPEKRVSPVMVTIREDYYICDQCIWLLDLGFEDMIEDWQASPENPLKEPD